MYTSSSAQYTETPTIHRLHIKKGSGRKIIADVLCCVRTYDDLLIFKVSNLRLVTVVPVVCLPTFLVVRPTTTPSYGDFVNHKISFSNLQLAGSERVRD